MNKLQKTNQSTSSINSLLSNCSCISRGCTNCSSWGDNLARLNQDKYIGSKNISNQYVTGDPW